MSQHKLENFQIGRLGQKSYFVLQIPNPAAALFTYSELDPPNQPYIVFQCTNITVGDDHDVAYLSSDGAGKMKLKRWNLTGEERRPPKAGELIDPALLFRVVKPLTKEN